MLRWLFAARSKPEPAAVAPAVDPVIAPAVDPNTYDKDGLRSVHNHDFMRDSRFVDAYERGVQAVGFDYQWHWRVHVGLWAASQAMKLRGDFVECGVAKGFLSSSIMRYLDWNATGRAFYLLDTFAGVDPRFMSDDDQERNQTHIAIGLYPTDAEAVRQNFAEWPSAHVIAGSVPETLVHIHAEEIAYLHIDMNSAEPEIAALTSLWDRLVPGAIVLLDDYAYLGYEKQKHAIDELAGVLGFVVLSLPTGQGLIIKA